MRSKQLDELLKMADGLWTNKLVIRLVQEYKTKPILWDTSHELYRVQSAKYDAWADLANMFGCEIADLRKKLNSLLASHRREKAKVRGGARSTWFLYPYMKFLPSHLDVQNADEHKSTDKNHSPAFEEEHLSDGIFDEDYDENLQEEVFIKEEVVAEPVRPAPKMRKLTYHSRRPKMVKAIKKPIITHNRLDVQLLETLKALKRSDLSRKKDECDSFGEYIAVSLRKHDERTQSMIKQAINNILFEQEMKKYNSAQYVVISNIDDNPLNLSDNDGTDK